MATFSSNQVRHLFVANAFKATPVTTADEVGTVSVGGNANTGAYVVYNGPGGILRSDLIQPGKISYAKATPASKMARTLRKDVVSLDAAVNAGGLAVGQDYLLRIAFKQHIGLSTEDQYFKYGAVRVTPGMTPAQFYSTMVDSLNKNFSREVTPLLKFSLDGATGIIIEEIEQPWVLGKVESMPLFYAIQPDLIVVEGVEMIWGTVTPAAPVTTIKNGKMIADLEYFATGERGDITRGINFPHNFDTTYLVNSAKEYSLLDISFYYSGDGEDVQKSQKVLTIAVPDGDALAVYTTINEITNALEAALGVTIGADLAE